MFPLTSNYCLKKKKKLNTGSVRAVFINHPALSHHSDYHYSHNEVSSRISVLQPLEVTVKSKEAKLELLKSTDCIWQYILAVKHIMYCIFHSLCLDRNQCRETFIMKHIHQNTGIKITHACSF